MIGCWRSMGGYLPRAGGARLAEDSCNWTQMIHRLVVRAGVDDGLAKGQTGANCYSIRHTFGDFLAGRVPDFAISAVMGHTSITMSERDRLFARGSPTTEIYKRRQLQPVLDVGQAPEAEWWPEIVMRSATLQAD
ncbi:site-specific integrase [Paracoccus aminovorans]|uniref:site-specific integrase n=1 Tax=Paracoccus aminovorans TaxID=34004 RepID=UPI0012E39DDC|nr:site-specific integrase [Paracoccus aminovorans]